MSNQTDNTSVTKLSEMSFNFNALQTQLEQLNHMPTSTNDDDSGKSQRIGVRYASPVIKTLTVTKDDVRLIRPLRTENVMKTSKNGTYVSNETSEYDGRLGISRTTIQAPKPPLSIKTHDRQNCESSCCLATSLGSMGFVSRCSNPELYEKYKPLLPPVYYYPKIRTYDAFVTCEKCHRLIAEAERHCNCGCTSSGISNRQLSVNVVSCHDCVYCRTNTNPTIHHVVGYLDQDSTGLIALHQIPMKPDLQDFYIYPQLNVESELNSSSLAPVNKVPAQSDKENLATAEMSTTEGDSNGESNADSASNAQTEDSAENRANTEIDATPGNGGEDNANVGSRGGRSMGGSRGRASGFGRGSRTYTKSTTTTSVSGLGGGATTSPKMNVIPKRLFNNRNRDGLSTAPRLVDTIGNRLIVPRTDVWLVRPVNVASKNPRKSTLTIYNKNLGTYIPAHKSNVWADPQLWWLVGVNLKEYAPYSRESLMGRKRLRMPYVGNPLVNIYQPGSLVGFRCECYDEGTGIQCPYSAGLVCDGCGSFHYCSLEHRDYFGTSHGGYYCPNQAGYNSFHEFKRPHFRHF